MNPFDDQESQFLVLTNSEQQYSLWPVFASIPSGWNKTFGPDIKGACAQFIEENWSDMRPKSLRDEMEAARNAK